MPQLFWIIIGYTAVLTLCFFLGEHLQSRRTAKKHLSSHTKKDSSDP